MSTSEVLLGPGNGQGQSEVKKVGEDDNQAVKEGGRRSRSRSSMKARMAALRAMKSRSRSGRRRGGCSMSQSGGNAMLGGGETSAPGSVEGNASYSSLGYSMYGGRRGKSLRSSRASRKSRKSRRSSKSSKSSKFFKNGIFRMLPGMRQ